MFGCQQDIGLHCALPSMEYISHIEGRKGLPSEIKRRQKVAFVMVSEISWKVLRADSGRPGLGATQAPALVPALHQGAWGPRQLGPGVVGPRGARLSTQVLGPGVSQTRGALAAAMAQGASSALCLGRRGLKTGPAGSDPVWPALLEDHMPPPGCTESKSAGMAGERPPGGSPWER